MASPSGARASSLPCKLFVGGLSAQTTTEALRIHFQQYGRLVDSVVMSKNGRTRGFGFVTFDAPAGAAAALSEPQWLDGRIVDVKRAVPGEHTQERPSNKIFVGGLPQDADTEDLRACFAGYGPVADAVVMVDRRTKRSRGFGFVRFSNGAQGSAAADAVLMDAASHRLGGKWIEVKRATPAAVLRDVSPCSGDTSSTCTPTSTMTAAECEQQAQAEAYLAWEMAANKMSGFDCMWDMGLAAEGAAGSQGAHRGRRGRRSRRRSCSDEFADFADFIAAGGCDEDEAALYSAAEFWAAHASGGLTGCAAGGMDWAHSAADLGASWAGFDPSHFAGDGEDRSSPRSALCRQSSGSDDGGENAPGRANGADLSMPPPGLGLDLSPMKVRCSSANLESGGNVGFTREDFLSMEVRPWLSAC
mmetsp:Transcript_17572/g.45425  ORF Transcript_17572/g.45425 Transcript_17572/m.45425 type:complete len:417 (+) Transcript_17572:87-1337(+)